MKLTIDVENTVTHRDGKLHLDPFEAGNSLVMVGMLWDNGEENIVVFDHSERESTENGHKIVQDALDKATIIICHNATHDLMWLWESGFKYDGSVFDTMLTEYVLQRGVKQPLSLEACAERYNCDTKKEDTLKHYFAKGYSVKDIPFDELSSYLSADLNATQQLSDKLWFKLNTEKYSKLMDTFVLTNQICVTLARIYQRGFKVDFNALRDVRIEFEKERNELQDTLQKQVRVLMGDTPINLNSPEQLGWVIYGRKVKDKDYWGQKIDPYMTDYEFRSLIAEGTTRIFKTKATQCVSCNGNGKIRRTKKDGTPFAKPNICKVCDSAGFTLDNLSTPAGLRFKPPSPKWASANGFSTSKINLQTLESAAKSRGMSDAVEFLSKVRRLSAVETYLSSFVDGISTHIKQDEMLHVRLLQHRTSTGRFSGADPNMQNMPRGGTFPVKKVFVSRWEDGEILEADFAQLEFRTAAYLSQDKIAMKEIEDGFDVHSYTARVISDAGEPTTRQEAKAHTFAPLYGATGFGRSSAQATYYKHFTEKYKEVNLWHTRLAQEALNTRKIKTPSGREFAFSNVQRYGNGKVSHFTQIKNYPVQSFATADIVPVILIEIENRLKDLQSCIVNTVHDSIVIDIHPDEKQKVVFMLKTVNANMKQIIDSQFSIDFNVPLTLDMKIGKNWLDTKDII